MPTLPFQILSPSLSLSVLPFCTWTPMAHPSRPAPGGIRRLSELLAEQQEPFLLDIYLLEKGHPQRSSSAPVCWSVLNASHGLRTSSSIFQLLKRKLSKVLDRVGPWSWDSNKRVFLRLADGGSSNAVQDDHGHLCSPPSVQWKSLDVDESKQRSPVSVLDLHSPEEHSPLRLIANNEEAKDFDAFEELLELASSPAFYTFTKSRKQLDDPEKLVFDSEQDGKAQQEIASLITSIHQLTSSNISSTTREWYELHLHVKEIGIHVEVAIFEEIREDIISEMLDFCCTLGRS